MEEMIRAYLRLFPDIVLQGVYDAGDEIAVCYTRADGTPGSVGFDKKNRLPCPRHDEGREPGRKLDLAGLDAYLKENANG